jgi:hypothetical protein
MEMQMKAAAAGLLTAEIPLLFRCQAAATLLRVAASWP